MNYATSVENFDEVVKVSEDIKLIIDKQAVMYLIGTELDYATDELVSEFTFKNPNSKSSCGCGKSFSV